MRCVVTGGMGCGKSMFVDIMRGLLPHYAFFDFDQSVRSLYQLPEIQHKLDQLFGTHDREQIRDVVYGDAMKMKELGSVMNVSLLHGMIVACQNENVILDVPLYYGGIDTYVAPHVDIDRVFCVTTSPEKQRERIRARNGYSDEKIDLILSHQRPLTEIESLADWVFFNNYDTVGEARLYAERFIRTLMGAHE